MSVTLISGDFDNVYNNERSPQCLREIAPYLNLAETLGAPPPKQPNADCNSSIIPVSAI